jgi:hypothetical protein
VSISTIPLFLRVSASGNHDFIMERPPLADRLCVELVDVLVRAPPVIRDAFLDGSTQNGIGADLHPAAHRALASCLASSRQVHLSSIRVRELAEFEVDDDGIGVVGEKTADQRDTTHCQHAVGAGARQR